MGIFGWSLPPGCGTLPGEETGAVELTPFCILSPPVVGVFWDEDGNLIEQFPVKVPADEYAGTPEYEEIQQATVGVYEWSDEHTDDKNIALAAARYNELRPRT